MILGPGDVVQNFTIVSLLGQGGMGQVYVARDTRLQRSVALKIVHPGEASSPSAPGSGGAARLLREAQAAAALVHPNIVTIYEVGEVRAPAESTAWPFIAMELVKGRPLASFVGDESVPVARRIAWLLDVARALAAAHRAGLVHRDVKPANVMVRDDGVIKVLDFGIAKRASSPALLPTTSDAQLLATLTAEGAVVGTPYYMAPEQMRGEAIDARADQFAWGVVAYELLAGTPTWGQAVDGLRFVSKLLSEDPRPLAEARPDVPSHVGAVVARSLAKRRVDRFATMDDLVTALEDARGAFAATARAPGPIAGQGSLTSNRPEAGGPTAKGASSIGRFAIPVAAVLVLGAAAFALRARRLVATGAREEAADAAPAASPAVATPATSNPAAAAAYAGALQAWGDGSSGLAARGMERAAALDPTFAAASLRFALWSDLERFSTVGSLVPGGMRAVYAGARSHRASASEYDRALIDAVEPRFQPTPDHAEAERRLSALAERFPDRGEPQYWLATTRFDRGDRKGAEAAVVRAETLEPWMRPALLALRAWVAKDTPGEALAHLDRCIALAPGATDCLGQRARFRGGAGACEAMASDAHAWVASDGEDSHAYLTLGEALFASGAPVESVVEALEAMERRASAEDRTMLVPHHRVSLAVATGDFVAAIAAARTIDEAQAAAPSVSHRFAASLELAWTASEAGDLRTAGDAAMRFLNRLPALTPESLLERLMPVPVLLEARLNGAVSRDEFVRRRASFVSAAESHLAESSEDERRAIWLYGYAFGAETGDDARGAIAALTRYPALPVADAMTPARAAVIGRAYELAGEHAAAIPFLRRGATGCYILNSVGLALHTRLLLANALAATGATAEARGFYRSVLERWGQAKPRSRTADEARARLKALGE